MKALTVKQPWASLIISGIKDVENRSIRTNYRGPLAIHVAKARATAYVPGHWPDEAYLPGITAWTFNSYSGHVIGTVELIDCVQGHESPWAIADQWHWVLASPVEFDVPRRATGRLGIWNWDGS
jgi:ASCH domain-containing protein